MKTLLIYLFLLAPVVIPGDVLAQAKLTHGIISYRIDVDTSAHPEFGWEWRGSKMTLTFNENHYRSDMILGKYTYSILGGNEDTPIYSLNNLSATKYMLKFTPAELMSNYEKEFGKYTIENTDSVKVIAGYTCTKSVVKTAMGKSFNFWLTNDISIPQNYYRPFSELKGVPLEFDLERNYHKMHIKSIKVEDKPISDDFFALPSDYKLIERGKPTKFNR